MSKIYEKSKFIEYLRETPLVSFACKKTGIARATYYRWYKDDKAFREQIQQVLQQGRENINDLAEATLIKMIKGENFNATRFWLQNNNKRYVPVRTTYVEPKHDHSELKPGETCVYCGTHKIKTPRTRSGGVGAYEQEIIDSKKKFEAEAKKKRKLNSKERKQRIADELKRRSEAEMYERIRNDFYDAETIAKNLRE